MLVVRRATLEDLDPMVGVYLAAWRDGFRHMFSTAVFIRPDFAEQRRGECVETVLHDDVDTLVAELNERVVGFCVTRAHGPHADLEDLWVHPAAWGSGAAVALVSRVEDNLRAVGGTRVVAWVPEDSPSGRRFFDKIGWKPTGRIELLAVHPEEPNRMLEYARQLAPTNLTKPLPRPQLHTRVG